MEFYYITNNEQVAKICDENGVIPWIDLETLGKEKRQKGLDTVKSKHSIEDIYKIKRVIQKMPLMVRINPINENSKKEIDEVIKAGAEIIMLPYFKSREEVKEFLKLVDKRCTTMLLFETKESVENIDDILSLSDIDKVHIGLNDLCISYKINFMFELVINGIVDYICEKFKQYGYRYGFGGIARLGIGDIPAEFIIFEHIRLNSSQVILSRSFCDIKNYKNISIFEKDFKIELEKVNKFYAGVVNANSIFVSLIHENTVQLINQLTERK